MKLTVAEEKRVRAFTSLPDNELIKVGSVKLPLLRNPTLPEGMSYNDHAPAIAAIGYVPALYEERKYLHFSDPKAKFEWTLLDIQQRANVLFALKMQSRGVTPSWKAANIQAKNEKAKALLEEIT